MEEPLEKWALILYVIGFILLFLIYYFYEPALIDIENLSEHDGPFKIQGKVLELVETEKMAFFTIANECTVEAVLFKDRENVSFFKGRNIVATGYTDEYLGKKQYVLEEIR